MNELVYAGANNQAVTTSVMVAKEFGKEHPKVIRSIETILGQAKNGETSLMFEKSTYYDSQNREQPMFIMNRDGFTLLAMSFTGQKAMQFKVTYIKAFNEMEKHIKEQAQPKQLQPMSQIQALLQSVQLMADIEMRTSAVESRLDQLEKQQEQAKIELQVTPYLSKDEAPEYSQRAVIRKLVAQFCQAKNVQYSDVWHKIYDDLYYVYHKNINAYKQLPTDKTKLDIAERNGLLPQIHAIVSKMVKTMQV